MPPDNVKAAAQVLPDPSSSSSQSLSTDEPTSQEPKRKPGSVWREGRYLYRSGPNGSTVFDAWRWTGEPVPGAQ